MKTLAIDCDGVLRDIHCMILSLYNYKHQTSVKMSDLTDYQMSALNKCDIYNFAFVEEVKDIYSLSPPIPGAIRALQLLRTRFNIYILSAQPTMLQQTLTTKWLATFFPNIPIIYTLGRSKSTFDFNYLVDDKTATLELCGNKGICFARPWNADCSCPRFETWRKITLYLAQQTKGDRHV